ncbi:MAG: virginiamycin B lyase, partial [Acidimicrobiia bacterium]|nr:virginiamycin B lyase [Acidimicrobiia bacterium]
DRITPSGTLLAPITVPGSVPFGITTGPDGNVWFADGGNGGKVGRITPSGTVTEFPAGGGVPSTITTGPDGNLWFTDANKNSIGRMTPAGQVTEIPVPTDQGQPQGITAGHDGNVWFTEGSGHIGRVDLH